MKKNIVVDNPKVIWILNIVVAVLCLLSILCYFFGPVWQVNVTYVLTAEQLEEMIGDNDYGFDINEVIGEEGEPIKVSLSLSAGVVLGSFGTAESTVDKIVDNNVDNIVAQLGGTMNTIAKKAVKSAAKTTVMDTVRENVKNRLTANGKDEANVDQTLEDLGFTDEYVGEKMDQIIDDVFEGGKDIDAVTENIMGTVDEVYADFQKNSAGKDDLEDFHDIELSPEERADIEESVRSTLEKIAQEDGSIDPDELIAELLAGALSGSDSTESENKVSASHGIVSLADGESGESSAKEKLASALRDTLNEYISDDVRSSAVYVFYGMAGLMLLSMIPWIYILIKLIVKFVKKDPNPTVKLAIPIWLGWLFFLILVAIPTIALWFAHIPALAELLASVPFLEGLTTGTMSFSITSLSCISAICALVILGISIYYIIVRKKSKNVVPSSGGYDAPVREEQETAASEE